MKNLLLLLILCLFFSTCTDVFVPDISEEQIVLVSPRDNLETTERTLLFSWQGSPDATAYRLQIVSPGFDSLATTYLDTFTVNQTLELDILPGQYQWQVIGYNEAYTTACCEQRSLTILSGDNEDVSNSVVSLVSPTASKCLNTSTITFSWQNLDGATSYVFQLAPSSAFNNILQFKQVSTNSVTISVADEGTYYWRVRAENNFTQTFSSWRSRSFTLDMTAPTIPILSFPLDGDTLTISDQDPDLSWESDVDAAQDRLFIYESISATNPVYQLTTVDFGINLDSLSLEEGSYFWRLLSIDKAGNQSEPSDLQSFYLKQ